MTHALNQLGIIRNFNGVHADQTRDYTHLHCKAYIEHIIEHHGWTHEFEGPTDPYDTKQLQKKMGFNYFQAIGELIYALTICWVDISPALITFSQHSAAPATIHCDDVKQVFLYLYTTKHHGLTYCQTYPREDLPYVPHPGTNTTNEKLPKFDDLYDSLTLHGACNATWALDKKRQ